MDILAARKKAAERARSRQSGTTGEKPGDAPPAPETQPAASDASQAEPAVTEPVVAQPAEPEEPTPGGDLPGSGTPAEPSAVPGPVEELELLCFRAAGESYAVPVEDVREVLISRAATPVPNAPEHILGVISLRGLMLPIIDLALRLGLGRGGRGEKTRIVVVAAGDEDAGLLVDGVTGVLTTTTGAIKPAPDQDAQYLRGIVRQDDKLHILLDLKALVND